MASGHNDKIDAVDLIITALKDHEKRLDSLSQRLENLFRDLSIGKSRVEKRETIEDQREDKGPYVVCNKWNEFKDVCKAAKRVAFEIDGDLFNIYSLVNEDVYRYSEDLPKKKLHVVEEDSCFSLDKTSLKNIDLLQFLIEGKLECGLSLSIKSSRTTLPRKQFLIDLSFECNSVREFLSRELNIPKNSIVEGKITY